MKTIAVLVDFSPASNHAVAYALHISKRMRAGVILYNLPVVLSGSQKRLQNVMAGHDDDECETRVDSSLPEYAEKLKIIQADHMSPGAYQTPITFEQQGGDISDMMSSILARRDIVLLVTAPFGADNIAAFMLSDNCCNILNWSTIPLMVIPQGAPIRNFEKIAFCTSLAPTDVDYINAVTALIEPFASEVMLTHLSGPRTDEFEYIAENAFVSIIAGQIKYGRAYYRNIPFKYLGQGWLWLKVNKPCDMLAIIQQPKLMLQAFFGREQTHRVTYHLSIPLLVYPETH
jgi:nucleotide-binding universal stress UspA family protein